MSFDRPSESLRRENLHWVAVTYIRDLILSGAIKPGTKIDQNGIAEQLEISRFPVREALITLESEGLITTIPRRGAYVAEIGIDDMLDHYRMYGVVAWLAAARVATTPGLRESVVQKLKEINRQLWESDDSSEHDRLNFLFHRTIDEQGSSGRLIAVLRRLLDNMPSHFFTQNDSWDFKRQVFTEHDGIIRCIEQGDVEGVRVALNEHYIHAGEQAVATLTADGFWG